MKTIVHSPYSNAPMPWLRGNLHTHTTQSDGPFSPQDTIHAYAARGYDFLMISDHDQLVSPDGLDPCGLSLISGNEITHDGPHLIHVDARERIEPLADRREVLHRIAESGGFAIFCHPNWESHFTHCPQELLESYPQYAGIEIFNGVTAWAEGNPVATDRWDRLLSQGRKVWGYAHDDCHKPHHVGLGWNMVQGADRSPAAIAEALRAGRFYASTGVMIERIQVRGRWLSIYAPNAARIVVSGNHNRRVAQIEGNEATLAVPEDTPMTYWRAECLGNGGQMAWTQPFWIE